MAMIGPFFKRLGVRARGLEPHSGLLTAGGVTMPCALGRGGLTHRKREGDGATPIGDFALRQLYFRPDRRFIPRTGLKTALISPDLGWCDDAASRHYNRPVRLPFTGSHEKMWRDDSLYDLVIVIGHNDDPAPISPLGSAIFLHLARPGFTPTEGCIALRYADLARLLPRIGPATRIVIG